MDTGCPGFTGVSVGFGHSKCLNPRLGSKLIEDAPKVPRPLLGGMVRARMIAAADRALEAGRHGGQRPGGRGLP